MILAPSQACLIVDSVYLTLTVYLRFQYIFIYTKVVDYFFLHLQSPHVCTVIICCLFSFCFCSFPDIFSTDFWLTSHQFSHEVASLLDKLKSTVLASRAPGTSLNYTRVFNGWRSFATEVLRGAYHLQKPSGWKFQA